MPLCSKLLDCKCDVVESECPSKFVVTGAVTAVGRNNEAFELSELLPTNDPFAKVGIFAAEWNVEERAPSKLVDVSKCDGAIAVIAVGTADSAGNFAVSFVAPNFVALRFATPNAGNATGEFDPKSSARTLETPTFENVALLISAHSNTNK